MEHIVKELDCLLPFFPGSGDPIQFPDPALSSPDTGRPTATGKCLVISDPDPWGYDLGAYVDRSGAEAGAVSGSYPRLQTFGKLCFFIYTYIYVVNHFHYWYS